MSAILKEKEISNAEVEKIARKVQKTVDGLVAILDVCDLQTHDAEGAPADYAVVGAFVAKAISDLKSLMDQIKEYMEAHVKLQQGQVAGTVGALVESLEDLFKDMTKNKAEGPPA